MLSIVRRQAAERAGQPFDEAEDATLRADGAEQQIEKEIVRLLRHRARCGTTASSTRATRARCSASALSAVHSERDPGHDALRRLPDVTNLRALRVLLVCLVCIGLGQSMLFAILPPAARALGISPFRISTIFATSASIWVFVSPWWGRQSDVWGRRPVILIGLLGFGLSMALLATTIACRRRGSPVGGRGLPAADRVALRVRADRLGHRAGVAGVHRRPDDDDRPRRRAGAGQRGHGIRRDDRSGDGRGARHVRAGRARSTSPRRSRSPSAGGDLVAAAGGRPGAAGRLRCGAAARLRRRPRGAVPGRGRVAAGRARHHRHHARAVPPGHLRR